MLGSNIIKFLHFIKQTCKPVSAHVLVHIFHFNIKYREKLYFCSSKDQQRHVFFFKNYLISDLRVSSWHAAVHVCLLTAALILSDKVPATLLEFFILSPSLKCCSDFQEQYIFHSCSISLYECERCFHHYSWRCCPELMSGTRFQLK